MLLIEFLVDKVPAIDSTWDAIHTFIRIPAGALLAAGATGPLRWSSIRCGREPTRCSNFVLVLAMPANSPIEPTAFQCRPRLMSIINPVEWTPPSGAQFALVGEPRRD